MREETAVPHGKALKAGSVVSCRIPGRPALAGKIPRERVKSSGRPGGSRRVNGLTRLLERLCDDNL